MQTATVLEQPPLSIFKPQFLNFCHAPRVIGTGEAKLVLTRLDFLAGFSVSLLYRVGMYVKAFPSSNVRLVITSTTLQLQKNLRGSPSRIDRD